jgi:hypothetical protein
MDKQTVAEVIKELQDNYQPDEEIIIDWWPMNSFEHVLEEVAPERRKKIWNKAVNNMKWAFENEVGYIWNAISDEIVDIIEKENK